MEAGRATGRDAHERMRVARHRRAAAPVRTGEVGTRPGTRQVVPGTVADRWRQSGLSRAAALVLPGAACTVQRRVEDHPRLRTRLQSDIAAHFRWRVDHTSGPVAGGDNVVVVNSGQQAVLLTKCKA